MSDADRIAAAKRGDYALYRVRGRDFETGEIATELVVERRPFKRLYAEWSVERVA